MTQEMAGIPGFTQARKSFGVWPWILLLVLLCATSNTPALEPPRPLSMLGQRTWLAGDGLLHDTVTALLETRDGFLWIGTEGGLARFDGTSFEPFSRADAPEFIHNEITALAQTPDDSLWIATTEPGLYRYRGGLFEVLGTSEGLPEGPIACLLRDHQGTLWVAPREGPLLRWDNGRFQAIASDAPHMRILALYEDAAGSLWAGTAGSGLWRMQNGRLVLGAFAGSSITALAADADGSLLVGTEDEGLFILEDGRLVHPAWAGRLPHAHITRLRVDRLGNLWLAFASGDLLRRAPDGREESWPGSAPGTPIRALWEDSSGALWVGREGGGLQVLHPIPFQGIPPVQGRSFGRARMVCEDRQGSLWCLSDEGRLGLLRQGRIEQGPQAPPGSGPFSALWPRRAGGLWLGTTQGHLLILDQGQYRTQPWPEGPPSDAIRTLYEDPDGSLWVALAQQGLVEIPTTGPPLRFPDAKAVLSMAGGGSAPLFLASETHGLGQISERHLNWLDESSPSAGRSALALSLDDSGNLWIGTSLGLRLYREGAFRPLPDRLGPLLLPIRTILEDRAQHLWLGTSQGLLHIPKAWLLNPSTHAGPMPLLRFDQRDGLPSTQFPLGGQPMAWLSRSGGLHVATLQGLARHANASSPILAPPLKVHILKTEADESVLPAAPVIQVPAGTRRFEVYYTATALTDAEQVRFRYRLEGLDSAWNEVGDRRIAVYASPKPGRYRFVLQAWRVNEEGPPQEQTLLVNIQPYLTERPAFWVLCTLLVVAFLAWVIRLRFQQVEAHQAVLLERNRMAREIHDHLAQGFTGVMLQLEAAEARLSRMQGDPEPILSRLEHARDLAASSLQEARRSVLALRPRKPEGTDLLGALKNLADRLLAGTDIQVELAQTGEPRPLSKRLEEDLLRMAQELLTNALRHGHARWVRCTLHFDRRTVSLSIQDDGQGFDPAAEATGYGMRSIRETVQQWRGHLAVESSDGLGSHITLTLPFRRWFP